MERIWRDPASQQSRELRLETLERLGGAERIVRRHVADAVAGLEPSERRVAAEALRFVVTPGGTKIALTPTDLSGMANDEHTAEGFRPVLKHLNGERILREVSARADEPAYELFHDKLCEPILDWRRRFEADRRQAALRRHLRRARRIAFGLALVTLSLIALGATALWQRSEAVEHRDAAQSEALVAESYRELPFSPERSMALAVQAWRKADSDAAAAALRRAIGASHLRDTLPLAPLTFARLAPGGVVAGIGPQGLSVWRPLESVRPIHRILPVGGASQYFAMSADGAGVGVYSDRGAVIVGTTAPGRTVALRHSSRLVHLAVGPHAALAAGVTAKGVARVWDARSGKVLARWRDTSRETWIAAFDPTRAGTVLLAGCPGRRLRIWSWRTGKVQALAEPASETRRGAVGQGCTIEVSPDGRRAVQTLAYGSAILWDLEQRRPARAWRLGGEEDLSDVSWSRDGRRVAVAAGKTALIYDAATGRHLATMPGHPDWALGVDLSPDGSLVMTTSADGTARVWDVDSRTLIAELSGHKDQVVDGMFLGHGNEVLTVSADGTARRWEVAHGRALRGHGTWVLNAAFDASGTHIATSARSGPAMVRNLQTGRRIRVGRGFDAALGVAFDAPGHRVVVAGKAYGGYGAIEVADARTGEPLHSFWPNAPVAKAIFSPDGRWVLSVPFPSWGSAELWRLSPSRPYPSRPTRTLPDLDGRDVAYSPDGGSLLVTGFDGSVRVTNLRGRTLRRIEGPGDRLTATYDPRGRRVLTLGSNGVARIWDLERNQPPLQLRGAHGPLYGGAFSRDGRRVVTGGVDQVTRVWDAESGRLLSAQREHGDTINSVSFSPDGTQILSAADDHTARLYPCATCDPRTEAVVAAAERLLREIRP